MTPFDRRGLLKGGMFGAATLALGSPALSAHKHKAHRAVVVAFAGGVRTRETFGSPANVPHLSRIAGQGVHFARTRASNLGHFGATLSILTGISEARGIRDNVRGTDPTLFEYLRKSLGWSSSEVWVSTSGGAQEANLSHSLHPDYGLAYGASTLDGDGLFNAEFKNILASYGRPRQMEGQELVLLENMRRAIGDAHSAPADIDSLSRIETFLLEELKGGTADMKGLGASDAKAFRVARNLMAVFRPRLLTVVVREADLAHVSFNNYVQVLRRNDQMLGELWDAIQRDPELADSTALFVLPEFGRDADLNSRRGLDHGDGSEDLNYVSLVCAGPDFRRGECIKEEVRTIDVCRTVCELMGAEAPYSRGKSLLRLLT